MRKPIYSKETTMPHGVMTINKAQEGYTLCLSE